MVVWHRKIYNSWCHKHRQQRDTCLNRRGGKFTTLFDNECRMKRTDGTPLICEDRHKWPFHSVAIISSTAKRLLVVLKNINCLFNTPKTVRRPSDSFYTVSLVSVSRIVVFYTFWTRQTCALTPWMTVKQ